ncbi:UNVERIFIED_CONTAM: histidine kinase [Acetivibrio alkalicellulosi]
MKALPIFPMLISLLTATLSYTMIVKYICKEKKSPILKKFILVLSICFIWSSGDIIIIFADLNYFGLNKYIIELNKYKFLAAYLWGPLWFVFSYSLHNNNPDRIFLGKSKNFKRLCLFLFFLPEIIQYGIYLTNDYLHNWVLYWPPEGCQFRPAFWVQIATTTVYLLAGIFFLIRNTKKYCTSNKQLLTVLLALFVPTLIAIIYWVFDLYSYFGYFDITPSMFLLMLILLNIATYKYNFLEILPLAHHKVIDNLNDAIIVIDKDNKIASINESYYHQFPNDPKLNEGDEIIRFINIIISKLEPDTQAKKLVDAVENGVSSNIKGELYFDKKYVTFDIQPLFSNKENVGRVVSLSDITIYRDLLSKLEEKNHELETNNKYLKDYAATAEELAVSRERNRFARDVHDSIGHTMSVLLSLLGACTVSCKNDKNIKIKLEKALAITKEGLTELRRSVYGLCSKNLDTYNLINALKKLIKEFEATGVKLDLSIEGNYIERGLKYSDTIYNVCKEALTNSLKHGKATQVNIFIEFTPSLTRIFIFDNGIGCLNTNKGMGLSGMEQRIQKVNGNIIYGSDGEKGFSIHAEIPVGQIHPLHN